MKACLCYEPVLYNLDVSKDTPVRCFQCGVESTVRPNGEWGGTHPILHLSWKLFPREKNHSIIKKEALAVKRAVEALRYYLLSGTFTPVTDHTPLGWWARKAYLSVDFFPRER